MTRNPFGQHGLASTLESTDLPGLKVVESFQFGGFPSLQSLKANADDDLNELGIIEKLLGSSPPWFK